MIDRDTVELLEREAARINSPLFIESDPVQFPRRFDRKEDMEIVALLAAHLAWGNRRMICRDCERLLSLMENMPHRWIMEQGYEEIPDGMNIHRTFFGRNLKHFCRGLRRIYAGGCTLDGFCARCGAPGSDYPAWRLAEALNGIFSECNGGCADSRCLPLNLRDSALKRLNMALRWMVRRDGIVDMGIWSSLSPSQLFIPLDVHVGDTARALGLTARKANDRRTAVEITAVLRSIRPEDPVLFDFALFGIPVTED